MNGNSASFTIDGDQSILRHIRRNALACPLHGKLQLVLVSADQSESRLKVDNLALRLQGSWQFTMKTWAYAWLEHYLLEFRLLC